MTSVRPQKRSEYQRENTPVTTWLVCGIVGAFLIQFLVDLRPGAVGTNLIGDLALSLSGLETGQFWTPLTYWLLHSTSNLLHVSLVVAGIHFLGRDVEARLGARHLVGVFAVSLLAGAAIWYLVSWRSGGSLIGATAGVYGLLAVYVQLQPNRRIGFLFFFIPVRFEARQLGLGLLIVDALAVVLIDVLARPLPFAYAPSAHLGGMFAGLAYGHVWLTRARMLTGAPHDFAGAKPSKNATPRVSGGSSTEPPALLPQSRSQLQAEVDRVLDKINSHGLGALTPEEQRVLDQAKEFLDRR